MTMGQFLHLLSNNMIDAQCKTSTIWLMYKIYYNDMIDDQDMLIISQLMHKISHSNMIDA